MHHADLATITERRMAFCQGIQPEPRQTVAEYADAHIKLPASASEPDQWRTSRTPFLKEIMECLSPRHPCHTVVAKKPVQIGMTTTAIIWACYTMDRSPTNMLLFEPDIELARNVVKDKLDPIIEATPAMWSKVTRARARHGGNTTFRKEFRGGSLKIKWASSAASLRSDSAERVILDEVDEYPVDVGRAGNKQGHPCELVRNRCATYPRYKIFELSTPTEEDTSRIHQQYLLGSQGLYHVPCPFCGQHQPLVWDRLIYTFDGVKRPDDAAYQCASCEQLIAERHKPWMMDPVRAKWVHAHPERLRTIASFHFNLLYQPYGWVNSWASLARDYMAAYAAMKAGDPGPMKVFTNTKLAEVWKEKLEKVEAHSLYQRREVYDAPVPRGVLVLTAAIDVQDNRLEATIKGWGLGQQSWNIDYRVFTGSPSLPKVWLDLTDWLQQPRAHADGVTLFLVAVGIDTGGHHTTEAYGFVERYRGEAFALKGSSEPGAPPIPTREPKRHRKYRLRLYLLGTIALKDTIFARLKLTEPGPGYLHFPRRDGFDQEYFDGLTSEVKKPKYKPRSHVKIGDTYEKIRDRNEPLDLEVYSLATLLLWLQKQKTSLERLAADWSRIVERAKVQALPLPGLTPAADEVPGVTTQPAPLPVAQLLPARPGRRVISSGVA